MRGVNNRHVFSPRNYFIWKQPFKRAAMIYFILLWIYGSHVYIQSFGCGKLLLTHSHKLLTGPNEQCTLLAHALGSFGHRGSKAHLT